MMTDLKTVTFDASQWIKLAADELERVSPGWSAQARETYARTLYRDCVTNSPGEALSPEEAVKEDMQEWEE